MGGGKGGSTSTVQIPPEVLARYNAVNAQAEQVAKQPFRPYTGQFVSALAPSQQAGILNTNTAASTAQPYFESAARGTQSSLNAARPFQQSATSYTIGGGQAVGPLTQQQIQYYQQPITETVINPTLQALQQQQGQQNSALQSQQIRANAFGGSRSGLEQAELNRQQLLGTSQALAPIYQQAYQSALQTATGQQGVVAADLARKLQAGQQLAGLGQQAYQQQLGAANQLAGIGTGAQAAALQGAQAQIAAGGIEQQTAQADLTARYNQYLQQQGYPFQVAQFLANIAEGTGALSGSTTTTTGGGGFFSDRRLKTDIKDIGRTHDGQKIYSYKYSNDNDGRTQIGLMAQEVEHKHPEAVGVMGGYRTVDYKKATQDAERPARKSGGLIPDSQGGAVWGPVAYAGGGLVDKDDWKAIQMAQLQGLGPFGAKSPGGTPGSEGYVPKASLHVPTLVTARPPSQSGASGAQQAISTGSSLANLMKSGRDLYKDVTKSSAGPRAESAIKDATGTIGGNAGAKPAESSATKVGMNEAPTGGVVPTDNAPTELASLDDKDLLDNMDNFSDFDFSMFAARGGVIPRKHYRVGGGNVDPYSFDQDQNYFPQQALQGSEYDAEQAEEEFKKRQGHGGSGGGGGGSALGTLSSIANIGSALFSMFSDERLKHDIKPVGKTFDGQNIYSYHMGDGKKGLGLIAQEVLRHKPEAVGVSHGHLTVNYDKATEDSHRSHREAGGLVPSRMGYQQAGVVPLDDNYDPQADLPSLNANDVIANKSNADDDYAVRTILTEAGNQGDTGMAAVGHVIKNRASSGKYGDTISNVVTAPKQFSPWNEENKGTSVDPRRISPDSPSYQKAMDLWNKVKTGEIEDPTKGATHFANVKTVLAQRGDLQPWLANMLNNPDTVQIGAHTFGKAGDEGAGSRKNRGVSVSEQPSKVGRGSSIGDVFEQATPDFVPTSSNFWIPALSGIGSMLASRNPTLGGAIGEGLLGGVAGYETNKKMQMEQAKEIIDYFKANYNYVPDTATGKMVYAGKFGEKYTPDQMTGALFGALKKAGVDPSVYGVTPPKAPTAPTFPGTAQPEPQKKAEAAPAPSKTEEAQPQKPQNLDLTEMNPAQLRTAAMQGQIPGVNSPDFDMGTELKKLKDLQSRYDIVNSDVRTPAQLKMDSLNEVKNQQERINQRINDAIKPHVERNATMAANFTKQQEDATNKLKANTFDAQINEFQRLSDVGAALQTGPGTERWGQAVNFLEGLGAGRFLPANWKENAALTGEALKQATIDAFNKAQQSGLSRAAATSLRMANNAVPNPAQDPGAFFNLTGMMKSELMKDEKFARDLTSTAPRNNFGNFTNEWNAQNENKDTEFKRQAFNSMDLNPVVYQNKPGYLRSLQFSYRDPDTLETFMPRNDPTRQQADKLYAVRNEEEYNRIPSGTAYIDPQGAVKRKK